MIRRGAPAKISDPSLEAAILAIAGVFYAAGVYLPWGWPSVDGYPAIERFIDASFLVNDFYTNTTADYNVDTPLAAGLSWAQSATGIRYDVVMAALNLLRCLLWPVVLFHFFRALSGDRRLALVGALLGAGSLFSIPNLFAWGWLWGDPSTAMFAVVLITAAWALFLDRRPAFSMLLFSAALIVHPLIAVHGGILTALIYFVDYRREEKIAALKSPSAWLSVLLFIGLFLAQYALLGAAPDEKLSVEAYTQILAFVRHPADFIPSLFPLSDWIAGIAASAAAMLVVWKMRGEFKRWPLIVAGLASYGVFCIFGYLFVELHPVRFFVELIPFRYVIVGAPLMLFAIATFAASELRDGRVASFLVLAGLFFAAAPAARFDYLSPAVSALVALWIALRVFTGRGALAPFDAAIESRIQPKVLIVALALILLALAPAALYVRRSEFVIPRISNQHPIYAWAANETPESAVFLIDQFGTREFSAAIDPQRMRLVGRRAVAASRDFPFLDKSIAPWNERWQTALGGGVPSFVSNAGAEKLAEIAVSVPYDYVVRDRPLNDPRFSLAEKFAPAKGAGEIYVYSAPH